MTKLARKPSLNDSEGLRKLENCGQSQSAIAKRLRISRQTVSDWFAGKTKPGPEAREKLSRWLLIPIGDFDSPARRAGDDTPTQSPTTAPATTFVPAPGAKALAALTVSQPGAVEPAEPLEGADRTDGHWPEINRLRAMALRPGSTRDLATLNRTIGALMARQHDRDIADADLENGWAKSQSFQRMGRAVYDALKPYPEAYTAVREALRANTPGEAA